MRIPFHQSDLDGMPPLGDVGRTQWKAEPCRAAHVGNTADAGRRLEGAARRIGVVHNAVTEFGCFHFTPVPAYPYAIANHPMVQADTEFEMVRSVLFDVVGNIEGDGRHFARHRLLEGNRHLAQDPVDAVGAAPGSFLLDKPMGGRVDLVRAAERFGRGDLREQFPLHVAVGVPVERVNAVGAGAMVAGGNRPRAHSVLDFKRFRAHERVRQSAVESRVDGDTPVPAHLRKRGHLQGRVGYGASSQNQDVHQPLFDPHRNIVADAAAHLLRARHARRQIERPAAPLCDVVRQLPDPALEVGKHVPQPVSLILGKVKRMPLPVQFHAVPVVPRDDFLDMGIPVLADFGDRHIPRKREPFRRLIAQHPLRVFPPHPGQLAVVERREVIQLRPVEMVVVHAHRCVDGHALRAAVFDQRDVRVLPPLEHQADIFGVGVGRHVLVPPPVDVPQHFKRGIRPAGGVLADAPEQRPHLRFLDRRVGLFEKRFH